MWQIALTLLLVAGVLVYLIRYYSRAYRSDSSICSSCSARHPGCECTAVNPESRVEEPLRIASHESQTTSKDRR